MNLSLRMIAQMSKADLVNIREVPDFTAAVIAEARAAGWYTAHFRPGLNQRGVWTTAVQGDGAGFPDLVAVREKVLYIELKREHGPLTGVQQAWRDRLQAAGAEWRLWRPRDAEAIMKELG